LIIKLQSSRIMLLMCTSCHVLVAMVPWHISLPFWLRFLLLPPLLISLIYQLSKIQLWLPHSIVALELNGEECRPLFRNSNLTAQLHREAWCSPLIQIVYFKSDNSVRQQKTVKKCCLTEACIRKIPTTHIALIICLDSCSAEEQRQLRKFLRWRVMC
jgi:hypothetical protein